jgi:enamine deaminase RidA (YjgF/YER057c/UK114 family)
MTPVEIAVEPFGFGSRIGASITVAVPSTGPAALEDLFETLEKVLAAEGLQPADVVRNRLIAVSRQVRDTVSAMRFRRLSGPARCASSSYIDGSRFVGGDGVRLDTIAFRGTAATKVVVEHDPPQPPCRFVATGDLVFLSGLTSPEPELHVQVQRIRIRLAETLASAGDRLGRGVRPTAATVYVHRSLGMDELADLAQMVGILGIPLAVGRCDGFSKPGKLIELEIDAQASGEPNPTAMTPPASERPPG